MRPRRVWHYWAISPQVRSTVISIDGGDEFLFRTKPRQQVSPAYDAAIRSCSATLNDAELKRSTGIQGYLINFAPSAQPLPLGASLRGRDLQTSAGTGSVPKATGAQRTACTASCKFYRSPARRYVPASGILLIECVRRKPHIPSLANLLAYGPCRVSRCRNLEQAPVVPVRIHLPISNKSVPQNFKPV
jgi:hypothetical protein